MSYQLTELAVVVHKDLVQPPDEYLVDKLFGHLPSKLWSTKVAVRGCLLVDRPLQVQLPREDTEEKHNQR